MLSIYNIHDDPFHSTVLCTTWFDSERLFVVRICVERVQLRLKDKIICPNRSREIFHYQGHLRYFTRHNVTDSDVCQWWRLRCCWIVAILFFLRRWCGVREIYRCPNNVRHTISMANENSHANTTQLPRTTVVRQRSRCSVWVSYECDAWQRTINIGTSGNPSNQFFFGMTWYDGICTHIRAVELYTHSERFIFVFWQNDKKQRKK